MDPLAAFLTRFRPADLLRLVALDAELRGLPWLFVDAIRAGVAALEASESSSTQEISTPGSSSRK